MDQFFEEAQYEQAHQPPSHSQQQHPQTQQNQWEQADFQSSTAYQSAAYTIDNQTGYSSNIVGNLGSSSRVEVDDEVSRKIAEEQDKINHILRQKSAKEYEEKQARKNAGHQQLQSFFAQKEKQLEERRVENVEHEKKLVERAKQLTQKAGWEKVFQNVNLKQGEYQGSKPVNRMRESIINKYEDDKGSQ